MPTILDVKVGPASVKSSGPAVHSTGSSPDVRPDGESRRDGQFMVLAGVVAMALIASLVAVGLGLRAVDEAKSGESRVAASPSDSNAGSVAVTLTEMAIRPAGLEVAVNASST